MSAESGGVSDGVASGRPVSPGRLAWRRFRRHRLALVGVVILLVITVACVLAPLLTRYGPNDLIRIDGVKATLRSPQARFWLGTNERANDVWSTVLYGGRVSLAVGIAVAGVSSLFGTVVGVAAGWFGGWIDNVLMRITDLFLALPFLVAAIMLSQAPATQSWARVVFGPPNSIRSVVVVIALVFWMPVARILRGLVLSLKEKEFVEAARAAGAGDLRIILRHLVPNCSGQIVVNTTLSVSAAILTESALSYLGYGVDGVTTPTWGNLLNRAQGYIQPHPNLLLGPGLAVIFTVLCINFVGDALRDALDPAQVQK
ncbi:MAG: ABC transporter permease [Actinomycetota bacterium]